MDTDYVRRIINDCKETSEKFRVEYVRVSKIRTGIDIFIGLAGACATIATFVALIDPKTTISQNFNIISPMLTIFAASLVLLQVLIERAILKDPPSRFADYAFYIEKYANNLEMELARKTPNWNRIEAWVALANDNLTGAAANWKHLVSRS
jgi:hypothetical protein